jgi:hypothetical protein
VERQGGFLTEEPVSGETGTLTAALQADGEDVWSRCPAWHQVPMRAPNRAKNILIGDDGNETASRLPGSNEITR